MKLELKTYTSKKDSKDYSYFRIARLNATGFGMSVDDCIHGRITREPFYLEPTETKKFITARINVFVLNREAFADMEKIYQRSCTYIDLEFPEALAKKLKEQPNSYWVDREFKLTLYQGEKGVGYNFQSIDSAKKVNTVLPLPGLPTGRSFLDETYVQEVVDKFVAMGSDWIQAFSQTTLLDGKTQHTDLKKYLDDNFKAVMIRREFTQEETDLLYDAVVARIK